MSWYAPQGKIHQGTGIETRPEENVLERRAAVLHLSFLRLFTNIATVTTYPISPSSTTAALVRQINIHLTHLSSF
jgi:hypothetical protein